MAAQITGEEMRAVGINVDLAPVADVVDNPANRVIGDRSFGTTADEVVNMVPAYVAGLQESHVAATLKHFAGHGSTDGDSHVSVVTVNKTFDQLDQTELPPFRAGAKTADLVMMAHVGYTALDPSGLPASLSKPIVEFLRRDIGFKGVVITDDLEMGAIQQLWGTGEAGVRALQAGVDLLLVGSADDVPPLQAAIIKAVRNGTVSESRIDESLQRLLALKQRLLSAPATPLTQVGTEFHHNFIAFVGRTAAEEGCP
jgi:beta-N-acetylhexosaminidase